MNEAFEQIIGYLRAIWRRRWIVLVTAWTIAVVGWVWVYLRRTNTKPRQGCTWIHNHS
jgi:hypothetical protein